MCRLESNYITRKFNVSVVDFNKNEYYNIIATLYLLL